VTTLVVVMFLVAGALVYGGVHYLAAGGGPRRGFAPGFEVQAKLSEEAVRRKLGTTRPATVVTKATRAAECGIQLGRAVWRWLYASFEEVVLVFAMPRMGKTALLANHIVDAPGACVATSTKADIYANTIAGRRDRPVYVFNPEKLGDIDSTFKWSPIYGCDNPHEALLRAGYLISGASESKGSSERAFWNGNAHRALRCHLMAAALGGYTMHDVAAWTQNLASQVPVDLLRHHVRAPNGWANELQKIGNLPDRTRESISVTLSSAMSFMADPVLADAATPGEGQTTFDVHRFLRSHATLYLLGKQREYGSVGPLFAALAGYIFETAQNLATKQKGGRLDPPLLGVLDEAALICRLPLERLTADCGGRGIPLVISVQGPDQLYDVWGEDAGRIIWNNSGIKLAFGGLSVGKHIDELVKLCGERMERKRSHSFGERKSMTVHVERVPVMRAEDIRELPDFKVLVLFRNLGPVIAKVRPVWERKDIGVTHDPPQRHHVTTPLARIYRLADYARRRNGRAS
jgi:type IV secretion system protein VirD4